MAPDATPTGMLDAAPFALRAFAIGAVAVLAGCATPVTQTTVRFVPPADPAGRACVQACDTAKTACQAGCRSRYQACTQALEPQVQAAYAEALERYASELRTYAAELRHAELQWQFAWFNRAPWHSPYRHFYGWDPWPAPYFPPSEPEMPTRESVRSRLEATQCEADCGCLPRYDTCFTGCGGARITETVCVANCPPPR